MSLCYRSYKLLESYGLLLSKNYSDFNGTLTDPVFKHWCGYGIQPTFAHYVIGTVLILICTVSVTGNLLVITVFSRYRRLRSPANTLIMNLAMSDMLNGILHPMAAYSSFNQKWMFEKLGCELYAGLCGLFGLVSIVTLTAIAIERCVVISVKPWHGGVLFTQTKAKASCAFVWIYCLAVILPPFFGWGAFVPEGFLTSCSFDYITRTRSNRSYFLYIFFIGFFIPVAIIIICYIFILRTIYQNEKDMKKNNLKKVFSKPKKRNDYKAAEMIMIVIGMFLISWTPYSVIAMIGQFGNKEVLTPWVSVLPSIFAKMSTIYNPAIYGLSHRHFRATLRKILRRDQKFSADRGGTYLSRNSTVIRTRNGCPCLSKHFTTASENNSSSTDKNVYVGVQMTNALESKNVIYLKKSSVHKCCRCEMGYKLEKQNVKNSNSSSSNEAATIAHGKRVIMSLNKRINLSLYRSLMFKSESSINQKYQTYLQKGHIIKIPSSAFCYSKDGHQLNPDAFIIQKNEFSNLLKKRYIHILSIDALQMERLSPNLLNFYKIA